MSGPGATAVHSRTVKQIRENLSLQTIAVRSSVRGADLRSAGCENLRFSGRLTEGASRGCPNRQTGGLPHIVSQASTSRISPDGGGTPICPLHFLLSSSRNARHSSSCKNPETRLFCPLRFHLSLFRC